VRDHRGRCCAKKQPVGVALAAHGQTLDRFYSRRCLTRVLEMSRHRPPRCVGRIEQTPASALLLQASPRASPRPNDDRNPHPPDMSSRCELSAGASAVDSAAGCRKGSPLICALAPIQFRAEAIGFPPASRVTAARRTSARAGLSGGTARKSPSSTGGPAKNDSS